MLQLRSVIHVFQHWFPSFDLETDAINRLHFSGAGFWYVCHANLGPDSSGIRFQRWCKHCSIPSLKAACVLLKWSFMICSFFTLLLITIPCIIIAAASANSLSISLSAPCYFWRQKFTFQTYMVQKTGTEDWCQKMESICGRFMEHVSWVWADLLNPCSARPPQGGHQSSHIGTCIIYNSQRWWGMNACCILPTCRDKWISHWPDIAQTLCILFYNLLYCNQIKSHYLLLRSSSIAQGRQVQAHNYQIWNNTLPINKIV